MSRGRAKIFSWISRTLHFGQENSRLHFPGSFDGTQEFVPVSELWRHLATQWVSSRTSSREVHIPWALALVTA